MDNNFFSEAKDKKAISLRLDQLERAKIGFYSVGLYPASLAYNCAMQTSGDDLLLAPREGRDLLGAFDNKTLAEMNKKYIDKIRSMSLGKDSEGRTHINTLSDLILSCELVILSSNSNYIEGDLLKACRIREELNRKNVVIACLVGSFCFDHDTNEAYVLCQKENDLAFFSGFHRHGSLRNPSDSFTANFCHPDALTALLGARLLDKLSPNIQVTPGVHNVEAQYIKATKNISSIFAGFAHAFYKDNPGILPTLLTLLLEQCVNQAATVSMSRTDRQRLYSTQSIPITELGYGVQRIEAALSLEGNMKQVRDHTFSQLTAIIADVKGSMMQPQSGKPTRNFQVGNILADHMKSLGRCPKNLYELIEWCEESGLKRGALEGIKSLKYWPNIVKMYSINFQDSSMIDLLYMSIFGNNQAKELAYEVLTSSRKMTCYCKESVKPAASGEFTTLLANYRNKQSLEIITNLILRRNHNFKRSSLDKNLNNIKLPLDDQKVKSVISLIQSEFDYNI